VAIEVLDVLSGALAGPADDQDASSLTLGVATDASQNNFQTGDIMLLLHTVEDNAVGDDTMGANTTHPSDFSVVSTASGGGTTSSGWTDFGYNFGGKGDRQSSGCFACVIDTNTHAASNIEVTITQTNQVRQRSARLLILRGVDTTNFTTTYRDISRTGVNVFANGGLYMEWTAPTASGWSSTELNGNFMTIFHGSYRRSGTTDATETHTGVSRFVTTQPTSGTWGTSGTAGGWAGRRQDHWVVSYFKTNSSFATVDGEYPYGISRDGTGNTNGGVALTVVLKELVASGTDYQVVMDGTTGANITNVSPETVTATEAPTVSEGHGVTHGETVTSTELETLSQDLLRLETVTATEAPTVSEGHGVTDEETVTATEAPTVSEGHVLEHEETVTSTELETLSQDLLRLETVTATEDPTVSEGHGVVSSEEVSINEQPKQDEGEVRRETLTISESPTVSEGHGVVHEETLTLTELPTISEGHGVVDEETVTASESPTISEGHVVVLPNEDLTATEGKVISEGHDVSETETLTLTESSPTISEGHGVIETETLTLSESPTISEGHGVVLPNEDLTATEDDTVGLEISVSETETLTLTESSPTISEGLGTVDEETVSATELPSLSFGKVELEELTSTESSSKTIGKLKEETLTTSESTDIDLTILQTEEETVTASEEKNRQCWLCNHL
jgi:hypothetical protein